MARSIEDLLQRRSDLSTFLVHLTRDGDQDARENLLNILASQILEARSVRGMGEKLAGQDPNFAKTQHVVCFTETPLEHVWMMCEEIEGRGIQFAPYGVVFTKSWARRKGVNPVWYIDITKGHDWLTTPINVMVAIAEAGKARSRDSNGEIVDVPAPDAPIARLLPFVEQMGQPVDTRKEFWWEREWRHVGDLSVDPGELVAAVVPEDDHSTFDSDLSTRLGAPPSLRYLDPQWGLERMLAALAGVPTHHAHPFPT